MKKLDTRGFHKKTKLKKSVGFSTENQINGGNTTNSECNKEYLQWKGQN